MRSSFFIPMTGDKFPVTGNKFPFTRIIFLVRENSFLMNFWSSFRCIAFLRQMCGIYNQNFVWDLKISWEPGSQVPRDSPTLVGGGGVCVGVVIIKLKAKLSST